MFVVIALAGQEKEERESNSPLTVVNGDNDAGLGGKVLRDIDVHLTARGVASKATHLLKRASSDGTLADILVQCPGGGQCQGEQQGDEKRERQAFHRG